MRAIFSILLILLTLPQVAQADLCSECPAPGSYWCEYNQEACDLCWENCSDDIIRRPRGRVPARDPKLYELPKTVGVVQAGNHEPLDENKPVTQHFTIEELFDELVFHGISAASIYTKQIPWQFEDGQGWANPDIKVTVVRPSSKIWTYFEVGCDGVPRDVWSEYPIAQYADFLYDMYRHLDKVIIFTDWELDHMLSGVGCTGENDRSLEMALFIKIWIARQSRALKEVRARYPDSKLRILYGPTVSRFPCNNAGVAMTVSEIVGGLLGNDRPDVILMSRWCGKIPLTPSLEWVAATTKYRPSRIIVAEIGERQENDQYNTLYDWVMEAWDFGVRTVFIWHWKQTWCGSNGRGMWEVNEPCDGRVSWGSPTGGYYAIQDLNGRTE